MKSIFLGLLSMCLSTYLSLGLSESLHAQALRPELVLDPVSLNHNTTVWGDSSRQRWIVPYFFETQLHCAESSSFTRYVPCRLMIWNRASLKQNELFEAYRSRHGLETYFIHDVSPFVSKIEESFSALDETLLADGRGPTAPHTLNAYPEHPYTTHLLRVPVGEYKAFVERYQTQGLGVFESSFEIDGILFPEYLRIDFNETRLKKVLQALSKKAQWSLDEKKALVEEALQDASLVNNFLSKDEARTVAEIYLRILMFHSDKKLFAQSLIKNSLTLIEEVKAARARCQSTLVLKADAEPFVRCERL